MTHIIAYQLIYGWDCGLPGDFSPDYGLSPPTATKEFGLIHSSVRRGQKRPEKRALFHPLPHPHTNFRHFAHSERAQREPRHQRLQLRAQEATETPAESRLCAAGNHGVLRPDSAEQPGLSSSGRMGMSEAQERRDAATLAGMASAPSASAGTVERPSSSGSKRKTKVPPGLEGHLLAPSRPLKPAEFPADL